MSAKIMGLVWDLDLDPVEKLVLLAYADHADHNGQNIRPRRALIAHKTGYGVRQVQRVTQALITMRILVPVVNPQGGRGKTVEYRIDFTTATWRPDYDPKGDTGDTLFTKGDTGDTLSTKGDTGDTLSTKGDTGDTLSTPDAGKGDTKGDIQDTKGDIAVSPQPSDPKQEPTQDKPGVRDPDPDPEAAHAHEAEPLSSRLPQASSTPREPAYYMPRDYTPSPDLIAYLTGKCQRIDVPLTIERALVTTYRKPFSDPAMRLEKFCLDEEARAARHPQARASPRAPTGDSDPRISKKGLYNLHTTHLALESAGYYDDDEGDEIVLSGPRPGG